ncbi:hypothetical protein Gpo141_00010929 [Globisporangium polare]
MASVGLLMEMPSDAGAGCDGGSDFSALAAWIEKLAEMVERQQASLEVVSTREKVARQVDRAVKTVVAAYAENRLDVQAATKLLATCKVLMRDRRGIDLLLTAEAFENYLSLARLTPTTPSDWSVNEEALKCLINSVYSRPEFVAQHIVPKGHLSQLLELAKKAGPASFHLLVWKCVLVSCEAPSVIEFLSGSPEAWELLYTTLYFSFHGDHLFRVAIAADRSALMLDLLKLIAVLANAMQWTKEAEDAQPELFASIHRLGELLLSILRATHPKISRLNAVLLDIKNKVLEVFMFIPARLLTAFIERQQLREEEQRQCQDPSQVPILQALVQHLQTMLLVTRVEKIRQFSEVLPTLIVCHNLTQTAQPSVRELFKKSIFPDSASEGVATESRPSESAQHNKERLFYFKHLTFFLTCLDTNVKRYAGEWLYLLCDQNADEYTKRTGLGNAIGILRIKGLA